MILTYAGAAGGSWDSTSTTPLRLTTVGSYTFTVDVDGDAIVYGVGGGGGPKSDTHNQGAGGSGGGAVDGIGNQIHLSAGITYTLVVGGVGGQDAVGGDTYILYSGSIYLLRLGGGGVGATFDVGGPGGSALVGGSGVVNGGNGAPSDAGLGNGTKGSDQILGAGGGGSGDGTSGTTGGAGGDGSAASGHPQSGGTGGQGGGAILPGAATEYGGGSGGAKGTASGTTFGVAGQNGAIVFAALPPPGPPGPILSIPPLSLFVRPNRHPRFNPTRPGNTTPPPPAAPDTPNTPYPLDGSKILYWTLSWISARAAKFDIYLDTSSTPTTIVSIHQVGNSYFATLQPSTKYYWQVLAINDGGTTLGPIWSFTTPAATEPLFLMGGVLVNDRVKVETTDLVDVNGSQPNTGGLSFINAQPPTGSLIKIGVGSLDDDNLIFAGELQIGDQSYIEKPDNRIWPMRLVDHTFTINKQRPFGSWVSTSVSVIARYLRSTWASNFTDLIQDGLPSISIEFDGQDDFMTCMAALAAAVPGGRTKVTYNRGLRLFSDPSLDVTPDPVDATHPPLNAPNQIKFTTDFSQVRTQMIGRGYEETVVANLSIGEFLIPVVNGIKFNPAGGKVIIGVSAGGKLIYSYDYNGVVIGGLGSLVGQGAAPSSAPTVIPASGTEIADGIHKYAYTLVTSGVQESIPSPLATVTCGLITPPSNAPGLVLDTGGNVDTGSHSYAISFYNSTGETTPSPLSTISTRQVAAPVSAPGVANGVGGDYGVAVGVTVTYGVTYLDPTGVYETSMGPTSSIVTIPYYAQPTWSAARDLSIGAAPDSVVYQQRFYRDKGAGFKAMSGFSWSFIGNGGGTTHDSVSTEGGAPPGANGFNLNSVIVGLALGPTGTVGRRIYRTALGSSQLKLVADIADNVTTGWTDRIADASLGVNAPTNNTAHMNRVSVSGINAGPTGTTKRNLYRTMAGTSQLKLVATIADNTTTTYSDLIADTALGVNAPTGDTSGLTLVAGQVIAGSTSILTTGSGNFQVTGGWVQCGSQYIRYTGIASNTLTGVPASGPGSITNTLRYGDQIVAMSMLVGLNHYNGLNHPVLKGSGLAIYVVRNNLSAQAALGQLETDENGNFTDGIRVGTLYDATLSEDALIGVLDSYLTSFANPLVNVEFDKYDKKLISGRSVFINLVDPNIVGTFIIQEVRISEVGKSIDLMPRRSVKASSSKFTLDDLLRRMVIR